MAIASRGFFCEDVPPPGISVDGVICLAEPLKILVFVYCLSLARRFTRIELAHIKHGSDTTYFSLAQLPRSRSRQRSLQKGKSALLSESVDVLQIGQRCFIVSDS
jgi:hypothetical protein